MADNIDGGDGSDVATPGPGTPRQPAYRGAGVSASLIIGIVLAVLTIILALQNTEKTTVEVFNGD